MTVTQEQAGILGDNVVELHAPGKPKRQAIHWSGQDYDTALEWFFLVRRRTQGGMSIERATEEADAALRADRLSKSGKGKTMKRG